MKHYTIVILIFVSISLSLSIVSCDSNGRHPDEGKTTMKTRDIDAVKDDYTKELMSIQGVVGVYIGALDDGTKCIGVMVDTLTPEIEKKIPKTLEGHPVRVDETGEIKPMK